MQAIHGRRVQKYSRNPPNSSVRQDAAKPNYAQSSKAVPVQSSEEGTVQKFPPEHSCTLRAILNQAIEDELIDPNPAARLGRFTKQLPFENNEASVWRRGTWR